MAAGLPRLPDQPAHAGRFRGGPQSGTARHVCSADSFSWKRPSGCKIGEPVAVEGCSTDPDQKSSLLAIGIL
jgi:hypothetical protein